jgi:PTH1 family peptidyl-tRNA hydrolase
VDALAAEQHGRFGFDGKLHGETCKVRIGDMSVWLLKPATFMNKSGIAVVSALRYYKIEPDECLLAHDELDLPAGVVRLKFDGGHGGQNGLRDSIAHIGHARFHRLRIGIGHPGHRDKVTPWVLGRAAASDEEAILAGIGRALDVLPLAVSGQFEKAMLQLHTAEDATRK